MNANWYKKALLRNVVDMHITDLDPAFLSKIDPDQYADYLATAHADSAVVYAHSHVGLCNYPTASGEKHKWIVQKDLFGDLVSACHSRGIGVVAYYSVIFNTWAYEHHPDWRIVDAAGKEAASTSRYGICCPNSPYREFVRTQIKELCTGYEFEGIRFDMTFWPTVCYCHHCRARFAAEVGGAPPRVVDWYNRKWVLFQRARERWLNEFAALCTDTVHELQPDVTVEHQASTFTSPWRFGVTYGLSEHNDFLQGDFYGDKLQGSFVCKQFYNLSARLPYGFETSSNVELSDHTTKKPDELLTAKMFAAISNGGAFVFIDAIDPVGTLNPRLYESIGSVFSQLGEYRDEVGGRLCQDIGIYLSTESKFSYEENGKPVIEASGGSDLPHVQAALGVAKTCIYNNLPFGVVTKRSLSDLDQFKVIVLPDVLVMDEEEAQAFRDYVAKGGSLYASKYTSLVSKEGDKRDDFLLSDVLGVHYAGETPHRFTYIAPANETVFGEYHSRDYPLSVRRSQLVVTRDESTTELGVLVLPYTDPADTSRYASIHSNPPGVVTHHPAVVANSYKKGRTIYCAGAIEEGGIHNTEFLNLLRTIIPDNLTFRSDAPKPVEITVFYQEERHRYVVNLLNFQNEMPNIPVYGITVELNVGSADVDSVVYLPAGDPASFEKRGDHVVITVDSVETFRMLGVTIKS